MKTCSKCGEEKPLDEYRLRKSGQNGKEYYDNQCRQRFNSGRKAKDAAYRERHRERVREQGRRWARDNKEQTSRYYQANKETIDKRNREYAIKHKEHLETKRREWYEANREYVLEKNREYRRANPEFGRRSYQKYMANPENREKVNAYMREARQRPERKVRDREYARMASQRPHNRAQSIAYKRKKREKIDDCYIKHIFKQNLGVKNPPQELIELKRVQLKIHRELNRGATK